MSGNGSKESAETVRRSRAAVADGVRADSGSAVRPCRKRSASPQRPITRSRSSSSANTTPPVPSSARAPCSATACPTCSGVAAPEMAAVTFCSASSARSCEAGSDGPANRSEHYPRLEAALVAFAVTYRYEAPVSRRVDQLQ